MPKRFFPLAAALCLLAFGCASNAPDSFAPVDLANRLKSGEVRQKADVLFIVFDASSSMFMDTHLGMKLELAKEVVTRLNQTLPDGMPLQAGMRVFGPGDRSLVDRDTPQYGIGRYTRKGLAHAISRITEPGGGTPLATALARAARDLEGIQGRIALVIVTDGETKENPVQASREIKAAFGDGICIYPVQIGDHPAGRIVLEEIARAGGCGFATDHANVRTAKGMGDFVERVFFTRPTDADRDGVADHVDRCPDTPSGTRVRADGCPAALVADTDGDGIGNDRDRCPHTLPELTVDATGCPLPPPSPLTITLEVRFESGGSAMAEEPGMQLAGLAEFLNLQPNTRLVLTGHTDQVGAHAKNLELSRLRAEAVKAALVGQGVAPGQISAEGYGSSRPIASNETPEGRRMNRRVEATLTAK